MDKTQHTRLQTGQSIFAALAYSDRDVFDIGRNMNLGRFMKNPVLLEEHNREKPIGQVTNLGWEENGLHAEFYFDTDSTAGLEAERKWKKGLKSSLSVGLAGKPKGGKISWELSEISQVTIPKDDKATATLSQRNPLRTASLRDLNDFDPDDYEEDQIITVHLTASLPTENERNPIATQGGLTKKASDTIDSDDIDIGEGTPDDDDAGDPEGDQAVNKTANQQDDSKMADNSQHLEHLSKLVKELEDKNARLEASLKEQETANKTLKEANEKLAEANAALEEREKKASANKSLDQQELERANLDLAERKEALDKKEDTFKKKEAKLEVEMTAHEFAVLLPTGFNTEGHTPRSVLEAAAPRGINTFELDTNTLRGMLIREKANRLKARLESTAKRSRLDDEVHVTGNFSDYISPTELLLQEQTLN